MTATSQPASPARERAHELIRAWDARPGPLGNLPGMVTAVDQGGLELLNDLLMRIEFQRTGHHQDPDDFALD